MQKESERHKQTYEQLYASYQSLIRRYRDKEKETDKLNLQIESKNAEIDDLIREKELEKEITDSKEVKIAELTANMQDLEIRLAQISAIAVTTTPAITHIDVASNTGFKSLHSSSLETTISSPTSSSLIIPLQEQLKKRDQTIAELQENIQQLRAQLMQSSDNIRVDGPCIQSEVS